MIPYKMEKTPEIFHRDRTSVVKGIMGPVGTGKSIATTIAEPVFVALEQTPWWHTIKVPIGSKAYKISGNIHHIQCMIVRKTYDRLKRSVIKSMKTWFGPDEFEVRDGRTLTGALIQKVLNRNGNHVDDRYVFIEYEFVALDRADVYDKLRSFEPTIIILSEVAEMEKEVVLACIKRRNRFPPYNKADPSMGPGPNRSQVVFDLNPPSEEHWLAQTFDGEKPAPKSWTLYKQPGAFIYDEVTDKYTENPAAENVGNILAGYQYWQDIIDVGDVDEIRRDVLGKYGRRLSGEPVYHGFNRDRHVAPYALAPFPGRPVNIGMDLETWPAAQIFQLDEQGRMLIMGYAWPGEFEEQVMFDEFLDEFLMPVLRERFPWGNYRSMLDPSGDKMNALSSDDFASKCKKRGIVAEYAPRESNKISHRVNLINSRLSANTILVCPEYAKPVISAMAGRYRYEYTKGTGQRKINPEKDRWADLADAGQYASMLCAPKLADFRPKPEKVPYRPRRKVV